MDARGDQADATTRIDGTDDEQPRDQRPHPHRTDPEEGSRPGDAGALPVEEDAPGSLGGDNGGA